MPILTRDFLPAFNNSVAFVTKTRYTESKDRPSGMSSSEIARKKQMKEIKPTDSILFADMDENERAQAMAFFSAETATYKKGAFLWGGSGKIPFFALVLRGTVTVCCDEEDGSRTIMAVVTPGMVFGGSLAYLRREADVIPIAATDCKVLQLHPQNLWDYPDTPIARKVHRNFTVMLAVRSLEMNTRIQILSKVTLRAKIEALFRAYGARPDGRPFTLPFDRSAMAFFLGADRSALSRELGRMHERGVLEYRKNRFVWKRADRT